MATDADADPDPSIYTIGWISAISTELVAAREFLDKEHRRLSNQAPNDSNIYTLGEVAGHNVVIAVLPDGEYGTSSAASVATDMLRTFKNIKIGLLVGVGGGAPTKRDDIRLGDVVVSIPGAGKSGVFQYDYGKAIQGRGFEYTRSLAPPPPLLRAAVNDLKGRFEADGHHIAEDIQAILKDKPRLRKNYGRPEQESDRLYKSDYIHSDPLLSCTDSCNSGAHFVVCRRQRDEYEDDPTIHYGLIASSNQLMKDAFLRDSLADEHRVLCFEMEAAGLMNHFPCLAIRGICDYSDTHKNKRWQGYAAMTAAAYTKYLLQLVPPARVQDEQSLATFIHTLDEKLQHVCSNTTELMSARTDDEITRWLSPPDPSINYEQALEELEQDSGSWYLDGEAFMQWKDTPKSTLWTTGIPGSGKTCLSAVAIRVLWKTCIYFFFDFRDFNKQTLEQLLRSLVFQVYSKPGMERARDWLKENFPALIGGYDRPLKERLYSALKGMLETANDMHIVIDAVDESTTQQEIRKFIGSVTAECNVCILLTCRQSSYMDWFNEFRPEDPPKSFCQSMTGQGLTREIEAYVRRRVSDKSEAWHQSLSPAHIVSGVCKKADGLFRLAACQLDLLRACVDEKDLKEELSRLPSTLNEMYSKALEMTPQIQQSRAMLILSLLVHSPKPLSAKEIKHALAIRTDDRVCWEDEIDWRSIKEITQSLTVDTTVEVSGVHMQAIQLAHSSVKDFLLSQTKCSFWDLTQSRICTTKTCLTYLLQVSKENKAAIGLFKDEIGLSGVLFKHYPFLTWAAKNWMWVARSQEVQRATAAQLTQLFQENHVFWLWRAIIRGQVPRNFTTPLDLASYFDLSSLVKKLLDECPREHEIKSAFAAVCAQGNWQSAQVLSRSAVTVPSHLLEFASSQGDFKLIEALTSENTTLEPEVYHDLLSKTLQSLRGDYGKLVAYLILQKDARASLRDLIHEGYPNNSFRMLCVKRNTELVEMLTENGLDFGPFTDKAIAIARTMRAHDIAQLLLQQLVDSKSTALQDYSMQRTPQKMWIESPVLRGSQPDTTDTLSAISLTQPNPFRPRAFTSMVGRGLSAVRLSLPVRRISYSSSPGGGCVRTRHQYGFSGTDIYQEIRFLKSQNDLKLVEDGLLRQTQNSPSHLSAAQASIAPPSTLARLSTRQSVQPPRQPPTATSATGLLALTLYMRTPRATPPS